MTSEVEKIECNIALNVLVGFAIILCELLWLPHSTFSIANYVLFVSVCNWFSILGYVIVFGPAEISKLITYHRPVINIFSFVTAACACMFIIDLTGKFYNAYFYTAVYSFYGLLAAWLYYKG